MPLRDRSSFAAPIAFVMANPPPSPNMRAPEPWSAESAARNLAPRAAFRSVDAPPCPADDVPLHGPTRIARPDGRAWMGWDPSPACDRRIATWRTARDIFKLAELRRGYKRFFRNAIQENIHIIMLLEYISEVRNPISLKRCKKYCVAENPRRDNADSSGRLPSK